MTFAEYVQRVMDEKGLSALEVERRSKNKITDGHVKNILKGKTTNPTLKIMLGLAEGLGVDPVELFKFASSLPAHREVWTPHSLVRVIDTLVDNPDIAKAVQLVVKQKPAKIKAILKSLQPEKE